LHSETANETFPLPCICNITEPLYLRDELSKMLATVSSLNKRNELRVTWFRVCLKIVESKTNSTYESFAEWSTIKKVELLF